MNELSFTPTTVSTTLTNGEPISLETGRIAKQAHGAIVARQGGTMVLVAACHAAPREGIDFFPLTVDYRESVFAAGKIPGGWFKRAPARRPVPTRTAPSHRPAPAGRSAARRGAPWRSRSRRR